MTVIATFGVHGWPIIIGDILLSGIPKDDVSVPSFHLPNRIEFLGQSANVTGLCQKIDIISDQLCLAWAGRAISAYSLRKHLERACENRAVDWGRFSEVIRNLPSELTTEVQFVAYLRTANNFGCADNTGSFDLGDLEGVHLFGTGAHSLFPILDTTSCYVSGGHIHGSPELHGLAIGLTIAGHSLGRQFFDGHGIQEGWGGGFELAFFGNSSRFMKLDTHLHVFLACVENTNNEAVLTLYKPFMYQFYSNKTLVSYVDSGDINQPNRIYVTSPFGEEATSDIANIVPPSFAASSVVASIRHINQIGQIKYAAHVWLGAYQDSPIKIQPVDTGSQVRVDKAFIAGVMKSLNLSSKYQRFTIQT